MTPERWKQIDELAQSALERVGDQRAAFLDEACAGDDSLRHEVESQIAYQQQASKFLEEPAFKHAAELIADTQTETESIEGRTISHYSILRKLGAGGMGEVYLAQDTTLSRKVAIKFLSQNSVVGEQGRKRLVREAKAAGALDHPHICAVHEVGEESGYSFIVMQYVEGETLASRIQRQPLEFRETLDIAVQIADALAEAHSHRIIHRDVKPQNVMLTASGQVKVLDFGLARVVREGSLIDSIEETESLLTMPGSVIGTVPYMSPEQVRGEALDGRSDIFSFGAVLYEMLSGRQPFQGESVGATMSSILTKEPAPLARYASDVPDELQRIVRKALNKNKEGRYQGIKDLLIDLRELKQELEFEAKRERSTDPPVRDRSTTLEQAGSGGRTEADTAPQQTVHTGESFTKSTTSSSRVVAGEIKRHKLGVSLTLAALVIAAVAAYFSFHRQPVLTDKDTILLADFVNTTGDPVLDGTLKMALAVQLEQSPFLNLFSDERVRQTLRQMARSPDVRVTREIALEICQRQGIKAVLTGSISGLGSHYVIALEAMNAQTGDVIARQQVEAENMEQVLGMLGQAASKLREKLGESLPSIQKFGAPVEQATTSSFEALRAFHLGQEQRGKGNERGAIPLYKRAVELDSNFALAYAELALAHSNTGQNRPAAEYAKKAFELQDRVSEREKFEISARYYSSATGEMDKLIEVAEQWKRTYPSNAIPHNLLALSYNTIGQYEKVVEETREAIRLGAKFIGPYLQMATAYLRLNRFDEARGVIEQAFAQDIDSTLLHYRLYEIAFIQGDAAGMTHQIDWARHSLDGSEAFGLLAEMAAFSGQMRQVQEFSRRGSDLNQRGNIETAARLTEPDAARNAVLGNCRKAPENAATAQILARSLVFNARSNTAVMRPIALALCGEIAQAQSLANELAKESPKDTAINAIWLPTIRAAIEIRKDNAAGAIQLLQAVGPYEAASFFWPNYIRALAYLRQKAGPEARAEFQKIIDHRGWDPASYLYPLAHLGLARAAVLRGDVAGSRKAYQDFLALWKDADADLPILIEAKKEYAGLK
jgi:serine/threonine protein kinase/tetratricopeptide (TPR) repeat protein